MKSQKLTAKQRTLKRQAKDEKRRAAKVQRNGKKHPTLQSKAPPSSKAHVTSGSTSGSPVNASLAPSVTSGSSASGASVSAGSASTTLSAKRRTVPIKTTTHLHKLTKAAETGIGAAVSKTPAVNRAKKQREDIWDGGDSGFRIVVAPSDNDAPARNHKLVDNEFQRFKAVTKSREVLKDLCKSKLNIVPPVMGWERWHAGSKLDEGVEHDPLLVSSSVGCDADVQLVKDLQRIDSSSMINGSSSSLVSVTSATVEHAVLEFRTRTSKCSVAALAQMNKAMNKVSAVSSACPRQPGVIVVEHKYSLDYSCRGKLLKLNHAHQKKLRELWNRYGRGEIVGGADSSADTAVFVLLLRYHSLLGHGMQCALPDDVFTLLASPTKGVSATFECFASPLNCRRAPFCSAFTDTDGGFGSLGSFFDVFDIKKRNTSFDKTFPEGGSFEVNPPFISSIMMKAVENILQLLGERPDLPLLFTVILPGWEDEVSWQLCMKQCKSEGAQGVLGGHVVIAAADHGYVSGAQHQRKERFMAAPFDTGVFFLGNERGREKYLKHVLKGEHTQQERVVLDPAFIGDLRRAFAQGVPTKAEAERRLRAGRGFGDLDGGGGVYRGKRKNKKIGVYRGKKKNKKKGSVAQLPKN